MSIKIAGIQMDPKILDKPHNLGLCLELISRAAEQGAQLAVLPECALTGYVYRSLDEARPMAETIPGPSTERLIALCRDKDIYAIVGLLERDGDDCYNAAVLVGPQGLIGSHRKLHLPYLGVDRFLKHGNRPPQVFDTELGKIGLGICYDINFGEYARVLTLLGAEMVIIPTNWPAASTFIPRHVIPTRAFENYVYCIAINRVGEERGGRFCGLSTIVAPGRSGILAQASETEPETLLVEIEPALARNKLLVIKPGEFEVDALRDRRPEFYGPICEPLADRSRIR